MTCVRFNSAARRLLENEVYVFLIACNSFLYPLNTSFCPNKSLGDSASLRDSLDLRLTSELVDLRAANANQNPCVARDRLV